MARLVQVNRKTMMTQITYATVVWRKASQVQKHIKCF